MNECTVIECNEAATHEVRMDNTGDDRTVPATLCSEHKVLWNAYIVDSSPL